MTGCGTEEANAARNEIVAQANCSSSRSHRAAWSARKPARGQSPSRCMVVIAHKGCRESDINVARRQGLWIRSTQGDAESEIGNTRRMVSRRFGRRLAPRWLSDGTKERKA